MYTKQKMFTKGNKYTLIKHSPRLIYCLIGQLYLLKPTAIYVLCKSKRQPTFSLQAVTIYMCVNLIQISCPFNLFCHL